MVVLAQFQTDDDTTPQYFKTVQFSSVNLEPLA
jgi:hypothetical protein